MDGQDERIKRTYTVTPDVDRKLETLAKAADRDKSAQLRVLVSEAYERMQQKQAQPAE